MATSSGQSTQPVRKKAKGVVGALLKGPLQPILLGLGLDIDEGGEGEARNFLLPAGGVFAEEPFLGKRRGEDSSKPPPKRKLAAVKKINPKTCGTLLEYDDNEDGRKGVTARYNFVQTMRMLGVQASHDAKVAVKEASMGEESVTIGEFLCRPSDKTITFSCRTVKDWGDGEDRDISTRPDVHVVVTPREYEAYSRICGSTGKPAYVVQSSSDDEVELQWGEWTKAVKLGVRLSAERLEAEGARRPPRQGLLPRRPPSRAWEGEAR